MLKKIIYYKTYRLLFSLAWICVILGQVEGTVWQEVTACYGADNDCCQYQMECTGGTRIILGALMYGTKNGNQDCQFGISNCNQKNKVDGCCSYNSSDTFTPFSASNLSAVLENCEGQTACAGWAPRLKTTPYSSYVWMQYACVSDKNITDMCQTNTIVGNDLFIRFNISSSGIRNSLSSQDCSCRISTPDCSVPMTTTLVDLDFHLPQLDAFSSKSDTDDSACSSASLELVEQNQTYNCRNTQLYTKGHIFERMTKISGQSPNEIMSLRNINATGINGPSYIVLYLRTLPQQPLLVNCFEPGKETNLTNHCQTTTSPQISLDGSTSSSESSSSVYTPTLPSETNTRRSGDPTSTISSSVKHGLTSAMSFAKSTSPTESYATQEHSLSSISFSRSTMPPTTSLTEQLALDSPSTSRPSHLLSRPQSRQATSIFATRPDSKPSTDSAIYPSRKYSQSSHPSVVTSEQTETSSGARLTSSSTLSILSTIYNASKVTSRSPISIYKPGKKSGNMSTTATVYQNENTNEAEATHEVDSTTQTTGATTGKTIDDSGNNNGLIIGVTVAVVLVILIIVAVIMVCLCIRIKRKEKIRRNYIRNTNIFYSFPEDYNDTGGTQSDYSPEADRRDSSFTNIPRSQIYESVGNPSPSSTLKKVNTPLYFDQYKIKPASAEETNGYTKDTLTYSVMPNDNNYTGETSNETIDFVNGVEDDDAQKGESSVENDAGKSVTFDPSVYYAQVRKEGKTKF